DRTRVLPEEFSVEKPTGQLRVIWALAGTEWLGSARYKGIVVDEYFRGQASDIFSRIAYMPPAGADYLEPQLMWEPKTWRAILDRGIDVVSFQTRTGLTEQLLTECRERGIATVFSVSDLVLEEIPKRIFELSDAVVTSSQFLAER